MDPPATVPPAAPDDEALLANIMRVALPFCECRRCRKARSRETEDPSASG